MRQGKNNDGGLDDYMGLIILVSLPLLPFAFALVVFVIAPVTITLVATIWFAALFIFFIIFLPYVAFQYLQVIYEDWERWIV